jgi:NAD(P)H-flavin reductase
VRLTLPIRDVQDATSRARIVRLDLGLARFPYRPGQAVFLGSHGQPHRRPYSLAAPPEDALKEAMLELLIGVNAEGQPGPHLAIEPGALVDIEGPVGRFTFPDTPSERYFLFIAGGTGIAPLRAMLRHALGVPHQALGLFYSARTPDEFAYERELKALADEGRLELHQTVTRNLDRDAWTGARGRVGRQELRPLVHDAATLCFVCGPPAFVAEIPPLLEDIGVIRPRIRTEEWSS